MNITKYDVETLRRIVRNWNALDCELLPIADRLEKMLTDTKEPEQDYDFETAKAEMKKYPGWKWIGFTEDYSNEYKWNGSKFLVEEHGGWHVRTELNSHVQPFVKHARWRPAEPRPEAPKPGNGIPSGWEECGREDATHCVISDEIAKIIGNARLDVDAILWVYVGGQKMMISGYHVQLIVRKWLRRIPEPKEVELVAVRMALGNHQAWFTTNNFPREWFGGTIEIRLAEESND